MCILKDKMDMSFNQLYSRICNYPSFNVKGQKRQPYPIIHKSEEGGIK